MKLFDYMRDHGLTDAEMGRRCGCSQPHMWKIRNGSVLPSAPLMRRIMQATNGAVTPNDFLDLPGAGEAA